MGIRRRPAATTMAAAGLISALTVTFAAYALRAITGIDAGRRTLQTDEALLGLNPQQGNNASALSAGLILAVSAATTITTIGIVRRSEGARYGAIGLFTILAFVAFAASLAGLRANPPTPNSTIGMLCGFTNAVIVALLLARSTANDFDEAERDRHWIRARGQPPARDRQA